MTESETNIRTLFTSAESLRTALEASWEANSPAYQDSVRAAITSYEECRKLADQLGMFSSNEAVDDISTADLQYLLIDYRLAELIQRAQSTDRKLVLQRSTEAYDRFLTRLDSYDLLSREDGQLYERFQESPSTFSTASTKDPAARREAKISRFRQEKELKKKLGHLQQNSSALQDDDEAFRTLCLTNIKLCTHDTFASLESTALELQILATAPPTAPQDPLARAQDYRERTGRGTADHSDRLDRPMSELISGGRAGPILSKDGKPLKPFTLLDNRQSLRKGVFKSGHNLPTMTIDEYLEEERRRGGIVEGGGEASGRQPEPDEDNFAKADEETMKAREWDEFTEANPKGSGNTLNRG